MKRFLLALALSIVLPALAQAQSICPAIQTGAVLTAGQWNACFSAKNDALGYTPLNSAGGVMTGELFATASTTAQSGFNLALGVAPTVPANGDLWATATGFFAQINGVAQNTVVPSSAPANQFVNAIAANGAISYVQPAFSNLSGNINVSQMNSGTSASNTTFWRGDGTWVTPAGTGTVTSVVQGANTTANPGVGVNLSTNPCTVTCTVTLDASYVRGWIDGCITSGGGSTTLTIAPCAAVSDDFTTLMKVTSTYTKTFAAWAVGSGNGGLDTGAIAGTTWYHVFEIIRTDTGVVDYLLSLSATAPMLPTNYTRQRYIASIKTDAGPNIIAYLQDSDNFWWTTPTQDISATNPGTAAVFRVLNTPLGVKTYAQVIVACSNASSNFFILLSSPDVADITPSSTVYNSACSGPTYSGSVINGPIPVRTDVSSQIRSRISSSGASNSLILQTVGWVDKRGKQ